MLRGSMGYTARIKAIVGKTAMNDLSGAEGNFYSGETGSEELIDLQIRESEVFDRMSQPYFLAQNPIPTLRNKANSLLR